MIDVSVVIGVRNRDEHLKLCLKSLASQDYPQSKFEVIVVNYGGESKTKNLIKGFKINNIKYIFSKSKGLFNESRAKNIGIKKANGNIIIATNADIIFSETLLSSLISQVEKNPNALYLLKRYELSSSFSRSNNIKQLIYSPQKLFNKIPLGPESAMGDFQVMNKKNWTLLKGYDERMIGWGGMDKDLYDRALGNGIISINLDPKVFSIFHQYHDWRKERKPIKHNLNIMLKKIVTDYIPNSWGELQAQHKYLVVSDGNVSNNVIGLIEIELKKQKINYILHDKKISAFEKESIKVLQKNSCDGVIDCMNLEHINNKIFANFISKTIEERDVVVLKNHNNLSIIFYNVRCYWILSKYLSTMEKKYLNVFIDLVIEKFNFSYIEISLAIKRNKQIILKRVQSILLRLLYWIYFKNKAII